MIINFSRKENIHGIYKIKPACKYHKSALPLLSSVQFFGNKYKHKQKQPQTTNN